MIDGKSQEMEFTTVGNDRKWDQIVISYSNDCGYCVNSNDANNDSTESIISKFE